MDLILLKLILLVVMIAATLIAGLLPVKVLKFLRHSAALATTSRQHKDVSLILCLLTCFSGGVFLATCFLHLFPELVENIERLDRLYNIRVDYPLAELLSCLGFFLLFFLEEIIILMIPSMAHGHSHGGHHGHAHAQEHEPLQDIKEANCCMTGAVVPTTATSQSVPMVAKPALYAIDAEGDHTEPMISNEAPTDVETTGHCQKHCPLTVHSRRTASGRNSPECGAPAGTESTALLGKYGSVSISQPNRLPYRRCISEMPYNRRCSEEFKTVAFAEPERCERDCEKFEEDPPILMKSSPHAHSHGVRSTTLVLALSIHSIIEGIALGVGDNASETTALFISLMVHKLIVAFSVGLQLARTHAHQYRLVVASMATLAIMTPIGALIGMAVQSVGEQSLAKDIALTVLQGLAVGTFLYVTFFEVLLHERDNEHPNLLKLFVMMVGFGLIGLLRLVDSHDHDHGGGTAAAINSTMARSLGIDVDDHHGHHH